jgi:aspartate aminotransferase
MKNLLSHRAQLLKPSPTLAMANKARELSAQGHDVVNLTVGEPDWATFEVASRAGIEAIQKGLTKYTPAAGIPELRQAIATAFSKELGVDYKSSQVIVGVGAKFVIYALLQMLLNPGDEVVIPSPYWVSYPAMAELASGVVKVIECGEKENYKLSPAALKKNISEKSKVLILCSPSNPTGLLYSREELSALAEVLRQFPNLVVISDDIYNRLVFTGEMAPHLLNVAPDLKERVIPVNGASKSYSMTGWRVGWALGPQELMTAVADFLSQSTSNVATPSQMAALAAIEKGEPELKKAVQKLNQKCQWMLGELKKMKFIKVIPPEGAFYFWLDVRGLIGKTYRDDLGQSSPAGDSGSDSKKIQSAKDVTQILLENYFVVLVPGEEFGSDGYIRLSFASAEENLKKGLARLHEFEARVSG